MHTKFLIKALCCIFFFCLLACSSKDNKDPSQLAIEIAREYLMKNATESPVLYEEKYLTFYDFIAMDSAGGEIENFTTMYDVDSLKKLCIKDQYSYCRQIVNTNRSIVFVPFYLFEKSKDDETEIKLFVTLLFAFLFVLSYLFYGCEHKQSITNKYPLFCKSFQKERACRINGVVLFTEELFTKDTKISAT